MKQGNRVTQVPSSGRLQSLLFNKGDTINERYIFDHELESGGMGRVFFCYDKWNTQKKLILKINAWQILSLEYVNMLRLSHDGVVTVRDIVEDKYHHRYIVMDYVEGVTLEEYLKKNQRMSEMLALEVGKRIACALDYVHAKGIVHRDVSPCNIIVQIEGNKIKTMKLIDFSLSLQIPEGKDYIQCFDIVGTPGYTSLEQDNPNDYNGRITVKTDQYSLAIIVYRMLTGEAPSYDNNKAPQLNDKQNKALHRAWARNPKERFNTCSDFIAALEKGQFVQPFEIVINECVNTLSQKHIKWIGYIMLSFVILIIGARYNMHGSSKEKQGKTEDTNHEPGIIHGNDFEEQKKYVPKENIGITHGNDSEEQKSVLLNLIGIHEHEHDIIKSKNQQKQNSINIKICPGINLEVVFVQAGDYIMGSQITDKDRDNDELQHSVILTEGFYIGCTEVTQEQFYFIMRWNRSRFRRGGKYPVENVTWTEARSFCRKLTNLARKTGQISENVEFTLPTEAMWEYAARGGNMAQGHIYSGSDKLDDVGWWIDNSRNCYSHHPVAQLKPNELGIYDMSGNVWEWCSDKYSNYPEKKMVNPAGSIYGTKRVIRGGSWLFDKLKCRNSNRNYAYPTFRRHDLGFRVVLIPITQEKCFMEDKWE